MNGYVLDAGPADPVLLCFHHAGGGSALFRGWKDALGPDITVCPVVLPGRERRVRERRFTDLVTLVEDLAAELEPFLRRPHAFFGHSMGALIAYQLTAVRQAHGLRPPAALVVSACAAPHLPAARMFGDVPDDEGLLRMLIDIGGVPPELLARPDWMRVALPVIRDDLAICASNPRHTVELDCPVHVFGGTEDRLVAPGELSGWQQLAGNDIGPHLFDGGHFYLKEHAAELRSWIAAQLRPDPDLAPASASPPGNG